MSFPADVQLINAFQTPFDNAIATARTCYSSRLIYAGEVSQDEKARALRDKIAESTYQAGHHTTLQHATFQFALDKISRQTIWSFLHAHSFYNSEQVSQRFVKLKAENFIVPPMNQTATKVFKETCEKMVAAYFHLIDLIQPTVIAEYQRIFPGRKMDDKRWASAIQKKSQEVARYVVPVAMSAHLYHTISGLTLHRYHKLMHQMDTPIEQAVIVEKMIAAVQAQDPLFFQKIEDPMPLEKTLEYELLKKFNDNKQANSQSIQNFIQEFDAGLGGKTSKLIDYKINTEKTFAQSIRHVLGKTSQEISDAEAIDLVMNPASNHYFGEALNLANLGKLTRSMSHAHFTFQKKISHTADSQDQRHRSTPASRPVLETQVDFNKPDYITPAVIAQTPAAKEFFDRTLQETWQSMQKLQDLGVSKEFTMYLLPNAFPIRFEESGDLAGFHHKWVHRLCYTAQEEIWNNCLDEVLQVREKFPAITEHIAAPCALRKTANQKPYCPEGDRFCGVPVWKLDLKDYRRLI